MAQPGRDAYDIVIVGAGVVGAAMAYRCAEQGARTLLLDAEAPGRATDAGAGILAADALPPDRSARWKLFHDSARHYDELIEKLAADGAAGSGEASIGWERCGQLIVAFGDREAQALGAYIDVMHAPHHPPVPASARVAEISAKEVRHRLPIVAEPSRAAWIRSSARVDGRELRAGLLAAASRHGLVMEHASVERLLVEQGRVVGVRTAGRTVAAGSVCIAAGAWSAELVAPLGVDLHVEPQRGQILHFELPGVDTARWPILSTLTDYYLVSWPGGRVAVGATRETGSGFGARPTADGLRELLDRAAAMAPQLGNAVFREVRVGLRPRSNDDLPFMGPVPGVEGAFVCTGHGSEGLTLGPYSGWLVAEQMLGHEVVIDPEFSVVRSPSEE